MNAFGEFGWSFPITMLEGVWFTIFAVRVFLIPMLYEDDLAELTEGSDGAAFAAFPKCLVTFTNGGTKLFTRNSRQILAGLVLEEPPFRRFAIASWDIGQMITVAFGWREFVETK
jgi:hypothetical protein